MNISINENTFKTINLEILNYFYEKYTPVI